jgi:hypothetical protein
MAALEIHGRCIGSWKGSLAATNWQADQRLELTLAFLAEVAPLISEHIEAGDRAVQY